MAFIPANPFPGTKPPKGRPHEPEHGKPEKHDKHHDHCKKRKPKHCKHHHKPKPKRCH